MSNQRMQVHFTGVAVVVALMLASASGPAQERLAPPPEVAAGNEAFKRQDWNAALENYRQAIANGNDHGLIHMRLGYALHVLGRHQEALPHHLRAAALTHRELRIDGLYNAACAYALTSKTDEAIEFLAKAIDAGFLDKEQVAKDTDLDSLHNDERFQRLVAGIGVAPTLHHWMDFFIGEWIQTNEDGEVVDTLKFARPLDGSTGLTSSSTNIGGGRFTGLAHPVSADRTWRWIYVDGMGSTTELIGRATEAGGMQFRGRDHSPVGPGVHMRLTYVPQPNGRVKETAEVSTDGETWHTHHEAYYVRAPQE